MMNQDDPLTPDELETVKKLKEAYMQDEGLPEDQADARAHAEVNRLAGRSVDSFGGTSGKGGK